jgi:hypothetical protein
VAVALASIGYQGWLVWRRPPYRRSKSALWIFGSSVAVTGLMIATWVVLWYRYQ